MSDGKVDLRFRNIGGTIPAMKKRKWGKKRREAAAKLTAEYLRECFDIDELGQLVWRVRPLHHFNGDEEKANFCNEKNAGRRAGGMRDGYWRIAIDGQKHLMETILSIMEIDQSI